MGRKHHERLPGLTELGARLKELRTGAGLSQMKLSSLMGFNPAHGYKYIFRLEKGQVPNPTLRTLQSYIAACGKSWQDIVAVLPHVGAPGVPETRDGSKPAPAAVARTPKAMGKEAPAPTPPPTPTAPPRDTRPSRVRVKTELLLRRRDQAASFWSRVERAEQATAELLHARRVPSSLQRRYFAFVRSLCSTLHAYSSAKPSLLEQQVQSAARAAAAQGLDHKLLTEIKDLCRKHLADNP
jgi:transcriptional regulator with XRE-family HTH domain